MLHARPGLQRCPEKEAGLTKGLDEGNGPQATVLVVPIAFKLKRLRLACFSLAAHTGAHVGDGWRKHRQHIPR